MKRDISDVKDLDRESSAHEDALAETSTSSLLENGRKLWVPGNEGSRINIREVSREQIIIEM